MSAACGSESVIEAPASPETIAAARQFAAKLDYVAADYGDAVENGKIVDQGEYDEQLETLEDAVALGTALPLIDAQTAVSPIAALVRSLAPSAEVSVAAREQGETALARHRVVLAPLAAPNRERAEALFRENCAKCHGKGGGGDGSEAKKLKIKPRSFLEVETMETMSPRRVFNAITDGILEAEMPQFDLLSTEDRWSIAFYVMTLRFVDTVPLVPSAESAAKLTTTVLANARDIDVRDLTASASAETLAWARVQHAFANPTGSLSSAKTALSAAIADHRRGRHAEAVARVDAIISDGLSAFRPALSARSPRLSRRIERGLYELRSAIPGGSAPALEQRALAIRGDLDDGANSLSHIRPVAIAGAATLAALGWIIVLLFVGTEATRAMRVTNAVRAIHLGWLLAVVTGLATLFTVEAGGELVEASTRHQVISLLRISACLFAVAACFILYRRLAGPVLPTQSRATPVPWWLAAVTLICVYGAVLDWAHHLSRIAAESDSSVTILAATSLSVVAAMAAMIYLLMLLSRRLGGGAHYAIVAIVGGVTAVAIAGAALRGLIDGGTLATSWLGAVRIEPLNVVPLRESAYAQLAVAGLVIAAALVSLVRSSRKSG